MKISNIHGLIFDLDGTIYLGDAALPGVVNVLVELSRRGKRTLFVSNKPLEDRRAYAAKLTRLGIPAEPEQILTSAAVLGNYLLQQDRRARYYVIGEEKLRAELRALGLDLVDEFWDQDPTEVIESRGIDAVVVAFDRTLDYRKLNTAYQALRGGARYYATNADKVCPMPGGAIPDAGATLAGLEHITGRAPDLVAGKPSPLMMATALEWLGLPPSECLIAGDRLETDIRMGIDAGMHTVLVLSGVTRREELPYSPYQPELVLDSVADLLEWIE